MKLFVKLPAGNTIPFEVDASDTIESVKLQIEQKEHIPKAKQALRYAGRTLLSHRTLGQYSIIEGTTLDLAVWMELEIVVRKRVWVEVEQGSAVLKVKSKLQEEEGTPTYGQTLNFMGVELQDGDLLAEHGIEDHAVLTANMSLSG